MSTVPYSSVTSGLHQAHTSHNTSAYGNGFNEVPAQYIRQIQLGEFFDLSKFLPKNKPININDSEILVILTLEYSVIKAKITNIARVVDNSIYNVYECDDPSLISLVELRNDQKLNEFDTPCSPNSP